MNIISVMGVLLILLLATKFIDLLTEHFLEKTLFSPIVRRVKREIKKLYTKFRTIEIVLDYNIRLHHFQPLSEVIQIAEKIVLSTFDSLAEPVFSSSRDKFEQEIRIGSHKYRIILYPMETIIDGQKQIENIKVTVKSQIEFHKMSDILINVASAVPILNNNFRKEFGDIYLSGGQFTCKIHQGELSALDWLDKGTFKLSLLIKTQEKINIRIYTDKATVISPDLQVTDTAVKYLRELILNYYF